MSAAQHPAWCVPAHYLTDPTTGEPIHRSARTLLHGDHEVRTVIAAGHDEQPRLFVEALDDGQGITAEHADAIAHQITAAADAIR